MNRPFAALLLFLVSLGAADRYGGPFDPKADPKKDLQAASALAARSGRRILMEVGGEWCGWCLRFEDLVLRNAEIRGVLEKHFVLLKVNWSEENRNESFLAGFPKVGGYPHFFVLDSNGKLIYSKSTMDLEDRRQYDPERVKVFLVQYATRR